MTEPGRAPWPSALFSSRRGMDPESLDTLAAAQAETGEFDKPIETMRRALERARTVRTELVPELRQRLAMYRRREPFRQ